MDTRLLNQKELPDKELVRLFLENKEEDAFDEIVNRYADKVYRLAIRILGNQSDAEEVLQEVFQTIVERLDTLRQRSKFSTWLYGVAFKASCRHIGARKKCDGDVSLDDYVPYDDYGRLQRVAIKDWSYIPEELINFDEILELIENLVSELPISYRIVFHLRDVERLSDHEIKEVLGLSLSVVKSRIHRSRLFLRDRMLEYFMEPSK